MEKRFFDLNYELKNKEHFNSIIEEINTEIHNNFESRHDPCIVKVKDGNIQMSKGKLLFNLFLLSFFAERNIDLYKMHLYLSDSVSAADVSMFLNGLLTISKEQNIDFDDYLDTVKNIINTMATASSEYNREYGSSISYYDFLRLEDEYPEFKKIIYTTIPDNLHLQFNEIEDLQKQKQKEIADFFIEKKDAELHNFIMAKSGLNEKQLTQAIGFIGLKPSNNGGVIPVVITDNYLRGLTNIENFYINCKGTRKAAIVNYTMVRRSGYLTKKLSLALLDRLVDYSVLDCKTTHTITYIIQNKEKLNKIIGRHYYTIRDDGTRDDELKTVTRKDEFLIGRKIALRSPVTCALTNGKVCQTCYGRELARINKNINAGINAVLGLTEPLTQLLLSAKHLLSTSTNKVEWGDLFLNTFNIDMDNINFADSETTITFTMPTDDNFDDDANMYFIQKMFIHRDNDKKGIEYNSPEPLYVNPKFLHKKYYDDAIKDKITIDSQNIEPDCKYIFKFIVHNNELAKSLNNIIDLVESSAHLGVKTYDELVNKFDDLLIENHLKLMSVHAEMISSILIRDAKTKQKLDFSKPDIGEYTICRISNSIMKGPLSKSLAFERVPEQFVTLDTYEKSDSSIMDYLFQ